jgi:hypothetical protein
MVSPANGAVVDNRSVDFKWNLPGGECANENIILRIKSIPNMLGGGNEILTKRLEHWDDHYTHNFGEECEGRRIYWSVWSERSGTNPPSPWVFQIASNQLPSITFDTSNGDARASILSKLIQWTFRGTASDPEGKLAGVLFRCEGPGYCGPGSPYVNLSGAAWSYVHNALAGDVTVSFVAKDNKHYVQSRKVNLRIDNVPPLTTAYVNGSPHLPTGWFNRPVIIMLRAADRPAGTVLAGLGEVHLVKNGVDSVRTGDFLTADGTYTIGYYSKDKVGNQEGMRTFRVKIDRTLPTLPAAANETNGTPNDTWQKTHNIPTFTWNAPTDALSGLDRYQLYFGTNPVGTTVHRTLAPATPRTWTPQPAGVRTGAYYLRIRAKDKAGNWTPWTTIFTYRFDNTPPHNPSGVEHAEKDVFSTVWQNYTREADFSWPVPYDAGSGVKGCDVYWGPDEKGTKDDFITANSYKDTTPMCGEDAVCSWYLRFRCTDQLDNVAPAWTTGFVLRYDKFPDPRSDHYRSLANAVPLGVGNLSSSGYIAHGTLGLSTPSETLNSTNYTLNTGYDPGRPVAPGTTIVALMTMGLKNTTALSETCDAPMVSIDDGAEFTNDLDVTVSLCSPYAVESIISSSPLDNIDVSDTRWNNYSVSNTQSRMMKQPWSLSEDDVVSQTLTAYVAFKDWDGTIHSTFFDDIIYDPDAPTGNIYASANPTETLPVTTLQANGTITMYLSAQDDVSGVSEMQIGRDTNFGDAGWRPFTDTVQIVPTDIYYGASQRTLYARFKDMVGNVSEPVSTTFIFDMQPPTGSVMVDPEIVGPKQITTTLTLDAKDEQSAVAEMRISTNDQFTDTIWMAYTPAYTWYVTSMEQPWEQIYVQYRDQMGNVSAVYSDTYIIDTFPPAILYTEVVTGDFPTRNIKVWAYDGMLSNVPSIHLSSSPLMIENVTTMSYGKDLEWTFDADSVVWVQVEDSVGNTSDAIPLYAQGVNVFLPIVIK